MSEKEKIRAEYPKSEFGERFVSVEATLKTWTEVKAIIDFDTYSNQFIIPKGFQIDTKVVSWEYIKNSNGTT